MAEEAGEGVLARVSPQTLPIATEIRSPLLAGEVAAAASYRRRAKSANTTRAYESDWRQFEAWCDERGLEPLPACAEAVATSAAPNCSRTTRGAGFYSLCSDSISGPG